jgi:CRP/FNR family transcriptional regulator, nitrogen oxide reductase regulator
MSARRKTPLKSEAIEPHACSVDLRLKILRRVPFFARLPADTVAEVNRLFREHGYTAGEAIYFAGDPARRLYVIATGKVKLMRPTLQGQEILLDLLVPGEFFGSLSVLGDETYPDTAEAQTSCCALTIAAEDFQTILSRHPAVLLAVLEVVSGRLKKAHEMVKQLSADPVERRIASALLTLAEKVGEPQGGAVLIQTPLSRQDLAAMTGATTETVSRVMSQFRKGGLIRSGRQWIAISDRGRLARLAAEGL